MTRLREDHTKYQLKLEFDADGRIVPTNETCADIIRALLDHRLLSPFSEQVYDPGHSERVKPPSTLILCPVT